jgi:hypothetical protein
MSAKPVVPEPVVPLDIKGTASKSFAIYGYKDNNKTAMGIDTKKVFLFAINPNSVSQQFTINKTGTGANADAAYNGHGLTSISFKTIIDGTKISAKSNDKEIVMTKILSLKELIYNYQSKDHAPNIVVVKWGHLLLEKCYVTQFTVNYNLFSTMGEVLRADVDLAFSVGLDSTNINNIKNSQSPDMSRIRVLNDEDKLSLMCDEFYGDSSKELQVAKENGIINFRKLKPGTEVYFPPIKK